MYGEVAATASVPGAGKVVEGSPATLGFHMPAEWEPHHQCWIGWPVCTNPLGAWGAPWRFPGVQRAFVNVVAAISKFEPVTICTNAEQYKEVYDLMRDKPNVRVVEMTADLVWLRDLGPTFVVKDGEDGSRREIAGVNWTYNSYGWFPPVPRKDGFNWRGKIVSRLKECFMSTKQVASLEEKNPETAKDGLVSRKVLELERIPRFKTNFVLEGGSIHVDGEGTCITTEQCLLYGNRNPSLTKEEIENHLRTYLGVSKVPLGLYGDDKSTSGHVDNVCCFVRPDVVLLAWTDDQLDPQHDRFTAALAVLSSTTDAKGRQLEIIKIHIPGPFYTTKRERPPFKIGTRLIASYVNFYIANGGIVAPAFGDAKWDQEAYKVFKKAFPNHEVVMVEGGKDIVLGGGNIHCTTQQQPAIHPII